VDATDCVEGFLPFPAACFIAATAGQHETSLSAAVGPNGASYTENLAQTTALLSASSSPGHVGTFAFACTRAAVRTAHQAPARRLVFASHGSRALTQGYCFCSAMGVRPWAAGAYQRCSGLVDRLLILGHVAGPDAALLPHCPIWPHAPRDDFGAVFGRLRLRQVLRHSRWRIAKWAERGWRAHCRPNAAMLQPHSRPQTVLALLDWHFLTHLFSPPPPPGRRPPPTSPWQLSQKSAAA
jgi:hypothetical protein